LPTIYEKLKSSLKMQITIFPSGAGFASALATLAGWLNRKQLDVINFLHAVPRNVVTTTVCVQMRYSKSGLTDCEWSERVTVLIALPVKILLKPKAP
jgi:hypothetical protein